MPYPLDTELDLSPRTNCKYFIASYHRMRGHPNKSCWLISHEEEIECFVTSISSLWMESNVGWGLKHDNGAIQIVGESTKQNELKFAKFKGDINDLWHGYPADYIRNNQDRPGMVVLRMWIDAGYILKHQMLKIRQGIQCNL